MRQNIILEKKLDIINIKSTLMEMLNDDNLCKCLFVTKLPGWPNKIYCGSGPVGSSSGTFLNLAWVSGGTVAYSLHGGVLQVNESTKQITGVWENFSGDTWCNGKTIDQLASEGKVFY